MNDLNASFWDSRYQKRETPWDLGGPTPVFERLIREGTVPKGRLLVPGAGRGYDAIAFARAGYQVTALDLSPLAGSELRAAADTAGVPLDVQVGDFFTLQDVDTYDAILEYTFFCAIPPSMRTAYRDQMARLLRPGGVLFGLFFPLKAPSPEGPPFQVSVDEIKASFGECFELVHEELPAESIKPRHGNEVLMIWRKKP
ncbi:MAG TPA: methyltransferase domain-containing protein [Stenomitos sp.]